MDLAAESDKRRRGERDLNPADVTERHVLEPMIAGKSLSQ